MKAYIGPFPPHRWYHSWLNRRGYYWLSELLTPKRKIKINTDKYDHWSAYQTIALVAIPVIENLRKNIHGYPCDFCDPNEYGYGDGTGTAGWDMVLQKIIWSLKQAAGDTDLDEFWIQKPGDWVWTPTDNPELTQLTFDPPGILNRPAHDAYNGRVQEGLDLFGKYFQNLWD